MTFYERLNQIGAGWTEDQRQNAAALAVALRKANRHRAPRMNYDDALGELADQLDTLACPIVVVRRSR